MDENNSERINENTSVDNDDFNIEIIDEVNELVPVINNNILIFKGIVRKLERRYKENKYNMMKLTYDMNNNIK
jgi:hypothetical protein